MKLPHIIVTILILVLIAQTAYFYPQLPETIASHFDAAGHANAFSSKMSFFIIEGVILVGLLTMFLTIGMWLSKMPDSMINLPNKEYWLAPERRESTIAVFANFFAWISAAIVAVFIGINQIALSANLAGKDMNSTQFWIVLVGFLVIVFVLAFTHIKPFLGTKAV